MSQDQNEKRVKLDLNWLRITQARRAMAYRKSDFIRFLAVEPDHDATYGKKCRIAAHVLRHCGAMRRQAPCGDPGGEGVLSS